VKGESKESLRDNMEGVTGPDEVFTEVIPYYGRVPLGRI
jgi:hypothetical protein